VAGTTDVTADLGTASAEEVLAFIDEQFGKV
jgi:hypothetical protein